MQQPQTQMQHRNNQSYLQTGRDREDEHGRAVSPCRVDLVLDPSQKQLRIHFVSFAMSRFAFPLDLETAENVVVGIQRFQAMINTTDLH